MLGLHVISAPAVHQGGNHFLHCLIEWDAMRERNENGKNEVLVLF